MSRRDSFTFALVTLALFLLGAAPGWTAETLAVVDIRDAGFERVESFKAAPGVSWWVELDDQLLVATDQEGLAGLRSTASVREVPASSAPEARLYLLRTAHQPGQDLAGLDMLVSAGGWMVVRSAASASALRQHLAEDAEHAGCARHTGLFPLRRNQVIARAAANGPPRQGTTFDPAIQSLVDAVDGDRWFADVVALAGFNRWTHGTEIHDARQYLEDAFDALPGLAVSTPSFNVGATTAFNVVATLTGTARPDEWYIVGAHYDAISENSSVAAPGAEDNASGCAGVLEMARILSRNPPEATIHFICYSGEEQGLHGSVAHASGLVSSGDDDKVEDVLIMDMIGYTTDADLDSLLEGNAASLSFIDLLADAGNAYTDLRIVTSLNPFGSDHVPYLNRGMRSVLTIQNDWNQYPGYHRMSDLPANLSIPMGRETLEMNVAALAHLAGAGARETIFSDGFENGDTAGWTLTVSSP